MGQGCCKVGPSLTSERVQRPIDLIGELASRLSNIGHAEPRQQPSRRVVEHSQQERRMPHTQLRMILAQGGITPLMQTVLNAPMASYQCQESSGIGS